MSRRYINEGSYGCVIKPGIKCKKKISNNTISKFIFEKDEWLNEINNYKIISKFLKRKHLLNLIDYCKKTELEKVLVDNCKLLKTKKDIYIYNIIYEYGGIDLYDIISNNNTKFLHIFFKFDNIFETVKLLYEHDYIHLDIRLPNILYNKKKKIIKLIDYGLMKNKKNISNTIKKIKKLEIYYIPPEFNNYNLHQMYRILISNNILKNNYAFYNNKLKKKQIQTVISYIFLNIKNYDTNISNKIDINKIDVYMIGIVLLELLIKMNINNNLNINDKEYYLVFNYIKKLLEPNVLKRYNIKEAHIEYKKLKFLLKKKYPLRGLNSQPLA